MYNTFHNYLGPAIDICVCEITGIISAEFITSVLFKRHWNDLNAAVFIVAAVDISGARPEFDTKSPSSGDVTSGSSFFTAMEESPRGH